MRLLRAKYTRFRIRQGAQKWDGGKEEEKQRSSHQVTRVKGRGQRNNTEKVANNRGRKKETDRSRKRETERHL